MALNRKILFLIALAFLLLSIISGVISINPAVTGQAKTETLIDDNFRLSPNEIRRQGIGNFQGNGTVGDGTINEILTLTVESQDTFVRNFTIISYGRTHYNCSTNQNVTYTLTTGADYYEALFTTNSSHSGAVHFSVTLTKPMVTYPFEWLNQPAKGLFLLSVAAVILIAIKTELQNPVQKTNLKVALPSINKNERKILLVLLLLSLVFWLAITAFSSNPLGTFENWYTDHARDSYVASLFLKDGLAVFSQPLDVLASQDSSRFMFVTWPEMPNLYPIGSIALFLPFSALLQNGVDAVLVYKLEVAFFLVLAHACLYVFLSKFWAQTRFPQLTWSKARENLATLRQDNLRAKVPLLREYFVLALKLVGVYIIYASLVPFAANGMFDAVAILFLLSAVTVFLAKRYDFFLLLLGVSILFKYQTGIFLLPLIIVAITKLLENNNLTSLIKNKAIILAITFAAISGFTAFLSASYLMDTRAVLVMNAINAFSPHAQIPWSWQAEAVLSVLIATIAYSVYMFKRNSLLSMSAVFLLIPAFTLPYFQNWYLPFMFAYILIPKSKDEFAATSLWLIFMVFMLSFGGSGLNPQVLIQHFEVMLRTSILGLSA